MMHTDSQFWLNDVYKIRYFNYVSHADCKMDNSKHLTCFGVLQYLLRMVTKATNEGKWKQLVQNCLEITLQEDNNISW